MDIKYFIKLYNKEHELIDELYLLSNINYTKTLNGLWNMECSIPITYLNERRMELILGQHIELYRIINNNEELLWYGVINSPAPFGNDVQCISFGYASLLQNRTFTDIEINSENEFKKTFYNKSYGDLIFILISEINNIADTGIILNNCIDTDLRTDRVISWDDDLYDKIQEFIEASNCYFNIDKDRKFNFYNSIGEDKSEYYEINDYNIVGSWDYTIDQTQIANVINARVVFVEDSITNVLISSKSDMNSINRYGRREMVLPVNDIRLQETLDKQCEESLALYKDPLVSCTVEVSISDTFNIFDIDPGDYVKLNSSKNNLNMKIRVLEYTVNLVTNTVVITLGNSIFRENKLAIYRYM
ncbi:MAG: phage tail protein [Clostridium celatum]|nr:phage tail protein [Clostridium celatum]